MSQTPRYYQTDAKDAIQFAWDFHDRVLLHLGTGGGKTHIIADCIGENEGRSLFIADQDELCQQPLRVIQRVTGIIPALHKAKQKATLRAKVVVGSAQTLSRKGGLDYFPPDFFSQIFIDECHRGVKRDKAIADYFPHAKICGVTATPFRANLANLGEYYPRVAYSKPLNDTINGGGLIAEGFAPPFDVQYLPVEIDLAGIDKLSMTPDGKEYNAEQVDSTIRPYLSEIAEQLKNNGGGERHGIAFTTLVDTSKALAAALRNAGISAMHVDGKDPDRDMIIQRFAMGQFQWLCNAGLVSTGVDLPIADAFLNLRLTKSMSFYQQAFGRVERVLPGVIDHLPDEDQADERKALIAASAKPRVIVYDVLVQHDRLGVCHPGHLVCANERDAKEFFEATKKEKDPLDVIEMQKKYRAEREAELVQALEKAAVRRAHSRAITADECFALLGKPHLIGYEPSQKWESERMSDKQRAMLEKNGIITDGVNKGIAGRIIPELIHRFQCRFATIKQLRMISEFNATASDADKFKTPSRMSIADASAAIDKILASKRLRHHEQEHKIREAIA